MWRVGVSIPQFSLYGEAARPAEPDFVHIEDISARSQGADWRIEPHWHGNLLQVVIIESGGVDAHLDEQCHTLSGAGAIVIPAGIVHAFCFEPATDGKVVTIAEALLRDSPDNRLSPWVQAVAAQPAVLPCTATSVQFQQMTGLLAQLTLEFAHAQDGRSIALESLASLFLMSVFRQFRAQQHNATTPVLTSRILSSFGQLLEAHYTDNWSVQDYATAVNTSVASLNRRCRDNLGLSPKALVDQRIMIEAKRRLMYTRETVSAMAYRLGFKDAAYFSRFFSKFEGMPPGAYRQKHKQGD